VIGEKLLFPVDCPVHLHHPEELDLAADQSGKFINTFS
jgi:hypothetical protein